MLCKAATTNLYTSSVGEETERVFFTADSSIILEGNYSVLCDGGPKVKNDFVVGVLFVVCGSRQWIASKK